MPLEPLTIAREESEPYRRMTTFSCGCVYTLVLPRGCGQAVPSKQMCARHVDIKWFWTRLPNGRMDRIPKGEIR